MAVLGWSSRRVAVMGIIAAVAACAVPSSAPLHPSSEGTASPGAGQGSIPPVISGEPMSSGAGGTGRPSLASDPLHRVELVDVNTGTAFTLGALATDGPVLLETMAIWCVNCRAQQHEVVAAHQLVDFRSVSLDVDPNERAADLADYSVAMGFDWRFAIATADLASALRDRFGAAVLNPPSTPMILLFPDGTIRALEFRGHSAEELAAEISAG